MRKELHNNVAVVAKMLSTGEMILPWTPDDREDLSYRARRLRRSAGMTPVAAAELAVKERLADGVSLKSMFQILAMEGVSTRHTAEYIWNMEPKGPPGKPVKKGQNY